MAIDGMDNWLKKLETMKKDFPKETEKFLMKKAEETIGNAKRYTPVNTGTLENAWHRKKVDHLNKFYLILQAMQLTLNGGIDKK